MRVLLSGFEPFGTAAVNPSGLLMREVQEGRVVVPSKTTVQSVVLPVTFREAFPRLKAAIDAFNPDIVIAFGLAGGRNAIEFERVALNCMDADIPDNSGFQPRDQIIRQDGAAAYFATLPIRRLVEAVSAAGIPARISNTAGLFVCNRLMYELLKECGDRKAGFVHLPYLPEQTMVDLPSLSLATMSAALEVILRDFESTNSPGTQTSK